MPSPNLLQGLRSLITRNIIAAELSKIHGLPDIQPVDGWVYKPVTHEYACRWVGHVILIKAEDLNMSLNDFSAKYLAPTKPTI